MEIQNSKLRRAVKLTVNLLLWFFLILIYQGNLVFAQQQQTQPPPVPSENTQAQTPEAQKSLTGPAPVLEIKRLESEKPVYSIELRGVELTDLFRVIAHDYNLNIIVDKDVTGQITASFTNISLEEALEGIADMSNLVLEKKGNIVRISPNLITKIFVLKYLEAKKLLGISTTAAASSQPASTTSQAATSQAATAEVSTPRSMSSIYDLLSTKGRVLLGAQPNSIIVIDYPPNVEKIADYIKEVDQKMTSKVFKLKYLKASDIAGDTKAVEVQTQKVIDSKTSSSSN